jgi:alpha-1,3-rhamnosyl/mannosyltransferase
VTGLGRYAEQLIRGLASIDHTTEYVIILDPAYKNEVVSQANFTDVRIKGRPDTLGNFLFGARQIAGIGADIYHSLHHFLPIGIRGKCMLTLHDLIWIEHPELSYAKQWQGRVIRSYASVSMKYALNRADHTISISEYTAERARLRMNLDGSRITVIPHGVDERFHRAGRNTTGPAATSESPFFLAVGNSKPNKNIGRVVGALALLSERLPEIHLRIVGRGEGYAELRRQVSSLGLNHRVDFLGNIPDDELLDMLRRATALVFPSLVEGFGLPVLEAQAAGCPVITSNCGVLTETAGRAAVLVDPLDSWDIARGMEILYKDRALRLDMIARGLDRAAGFTWQSTAEKTRRVYELLLEQGSAEGAPCRQPAVAGAA